MYRSCLLDAERYVRAAMSALVAMALICGHMPVAAAEPPPAASVRLASDGQAIMPIVVPAHASNALKATARELATQLQRISEATFDVTTGDGRTGIAVGLVRDFPNLNVTSEFDDAGLARDEQYLLRSHDGGLYVIGRTDQAVRHAVWDLLYRLGHRQFFPGAAWEIVPTSRSLQVEVNALETPDYISRDIWPGYNTWPDNRAEWDTYNIRNRMASGFKLNTGHVYDTIVKLPPFKEHPEYLALVKGKRTGDKMCLSNPAVQQLIVQYALGYLEARPTEQSVSVEPSDGDNWCECDECAKLGTPSDRTLKIANLVAEAVQVQFPGRYVAFYAYHTHSNPPTQDDLKAHPFVVVNVATAFILRPPEKLIQGWLAHGVRQFGIREYYGVNVWDRDLPGAGRGGQIDYLRRTIPDFHGLGARFMTAEASDNWGPNGLGYYLAGRMLWDVEAADDLEALQQDFYEKAFGPAASPMSEFYRRINLDKPLLSSDLIGRMYRDLHEATRLAAGDAAIQERINHLILYTHYVEKFNAYSIAQGESRQAAFEDVIRYAYRIRRTHMVHSMGLYRDLPGRDKAVIVPSEARWDVPEDKNPWKETAPFTQAELDELVVNGIAGNPLMAFQAKTFSDDLMAADMLELQAPLATTAISSRDTVRYETWIDKAPATVPLTVTPGLIPAYRNRGDATIRLFWAGATDGEAIDQVSLPPDGQPHDITLKTSHAGRHWVEISDQDNLTSVEVPASIPWTLPLAHSRTPQPYRLYFYVPKGTELVAGYSHTDGTIFDADGKKIFDLPKEAGYFSIPVEPGQDGKLWVALVNLAKTKFTLMTVPPYLAPSPRHLLLPKEVVEQDR